MDQVESLKKGVKTSEFWVSLIPMIILPLLSIFGLGEEAKNIAPYLVGSAGVYTGGRSVVKSKS